MAKIYRMNDYISPSRALDNRMRLFDCNFHKDMAELREQDEIIYEESQLTSLGLPVLCTIPSLPSQDEVSSAARDTAEIEAFISRARIIAEREGKDV